MSMGVTIAVARPRVLGVELEELTVAMLREEVAKRSGCVLGGLGTESINLISTGKVLKDGYGSEKLAQLGGKILGSRVYVP